MRASPAHTEAPRIEYVFVRGNIGAGKSTVVERLVNELGSVLRARIGARCAVRVVAALEPVDAFTDVRHERPADDPVAAAVPADDASLLARALANDRRRPASAALFQAMALVERVTSVERAVERALAEHRASLDRRPLALYVVCERSLADDADVFVRVLHAAGRIDATEHCAYRRMYDFWARRLYPGRHALTVYWRAPAALCAQRAAARCRAEDATTPLDYLRTLERAHDEALFTVEYADSVVRALDGERALRVIAPSSSWPLVVFGVDRLGDTRHDDRLVAWVARVCAAEIFACARERRALADVATFRRV